MNRRWLIERKVTIVLALILGAVAIGAASCVETSAFAAPSSDAPGLPAGLPWAAIAMGAMVLLQILTIGITYARGSASRIAKVEDDMRSEIKAMARCWQGLHSGFRKMSESFTKAINDERVARYEADVSCARRHDETMPRKPVLLDVPDIAEVNSGR